MYILCSLGLYSPERILQEDRKTRKKVEKFDAK